MLKFVHLYIFDKLSIEPIFVSIKSKLFATKSNIKSAQILLSADKRFSYELFKAFMDEFAAWKATVLKTAYNDDHLIGAIYKENVFFKSESEYTQLCRCHVEMAAQCLGVILAEVQNAPEN